jgi:hypothetical protein
LADKHNLEKTLEELHRVHFPGTQRGEVTTEGQGQSNLGAFVATREDWELTGRVISQSKIRWAINMFKPFKLARTDGIVPALLQQGIEHLVAHLCHVFSACLAKEYIPKAWRQVKVTFIPKPGKANYTKGKEYLPIILSSFMLKEVEKLVDRHIRDKILRFYPFHQNQFDYQPGKSTETALHNVVTPTEDAVEHREIALGVFLDIEGAFDNTYF